MIIEDTPEEPPENADPIADPATKSNKINKK